MYCYKCGKQIRDDAQFCQYCGTAQSRQGNNIRAGNPNTASNPDSNRDLDRNALKIYLGDVLSLECIKANYERKICSLRNSIQQIKRKNYYRSYDVNKDRYLGSLVYFWYNGKEYCIAWRKDNVGPFLGNGGTGLHSTDLYEWASIPNDSAIEWLRKPSQWYSATDYLSSFWEKRKQQEKARDLFFEAYENFKSEAPAAYQKNMKTINDMEQKVTGVLKELNSVKMLLKKAYDVNIIPEALRHKIYAIYYLYNYISTSQESLTTALLHFDLDEIKSKLDKIIAQQETIIIQNARMMAQNNKLLEQNQQQLNHLSNIENNTDRAAQYSKIAANNAETCAWISIANYIETH